MKKKITHPEFLTFTQVAASLGVSEKTVRRYCDAGVLAYEEFAGRRLVSTVERDRFVVERTSSALAQEAA